MLTVKGRRSGIARTRPIIVIEDEGNRWLVALSGSSREGPQGVNPRAQLRVGRHRSGPLDRGGSRRRARRGEGIRHPVESGIAGISTTAQMTLLRRSLWTPPCIPPFGSRPFDRSSRAAPAPPRARAEPADSAVTRDLGRRARLQQRRSRSIVMLGSTSKSACRRVQRRRENLTPGAVLSAPMSSRER
jgi:hypothetical protein